MRHYIKKIQAKEEDSRKRIFIGLMIVSVLVVGSIWIYNLSDRLGPKTAAKAREDVKPFQLFGGAVSETFNNVKSSVKNIPSISNSKTEEKVVDLVPVQSLESSQ